MVEPDAAWVLRLLAGAALAGVEPCQYQADIAPSDLAEAQTFRSVRVPRPWHAGERNRGRLTAPDTGRSPGDVLGEASVESSARSLCNRALLSIIGPAAFSIDEPVAASSENARAGSIDPFDSTPGPRAR